MRRGTYVILALLIVGVLTACGGSDPSSVPSSVTAATGGPTTPAGGTTPATTAPPAGPFISTIYGYAVRSPDWTGTMATTAWDGTSALGDGDPEVDLLVGPDGQRVFAYGGPTKAGLRKFTAVSRAANAKAHPCPKKPEKTGSTTIGGEPAILDEMHCPPGTGVFALTAFVIHAGHVYVFGTYEQPGHEAVMRAWFDSFLRDVSFDV
jgi:hypothetical protein